MNQQIDNALGGYEESVCTLGGGANWPEQGAPVSAQPAPDTPLEQIKELRPKVTQGRWDFGKYLICKDYQPYYVTYRHSEVEVCSLTYAEDGQLIALAPQMADRIIADAEERKQDALIITKSAEREAALLGMIKELERKFNPDYDCKAILVKELNELKAENEALELKLQETDSGIVAEQANNKLLEEENQRLKSRLDMDWIYNHRGEKEPWQEGMPDKIDCLEQEIMLLKQALENKS